MFSQNTSIVLIVLLASQHLVPFSCTKASSDFPAESIQMQQEPEATTVVATDGDKNFLTCTHFMMGFYSLLLLKVIKAKRQTIELPQNEEDASDSNDGLLDLEEEGVNWFASEWRQTRVFLILIFSILVTWLPFLVRAASGSYQNFSMHNGLCRLF